MSCVSPSDTSELLATSLDMFFFLLSQLNIQTEQDRPSGSSPLRAAASRLHHHAFIWTSTLTQQSDLTIKDQKMLSVCKRDAGPDVLPGKDELCVLTQLCLHGFQALTRCLHGAQPLCLRSPAGNFFLSCSLMVHKHQSDFWRALEKFKNCEIF